MADKSPAFQFYPKDFLADMNVALMSLEERGAYITLLSMCWIEGRLPNDMARLGRLCGCDGDRMAELWQGLEACFDETEDGQWLVNPRLIEERKKQEEYRNRMSEAGKKGARARWGNGSE